MNEIRRLIVGALRRERQRQVEVEGRTAEHDAIEHADGTLAVAAAAYAAPGIRVWDGNGRWVDAWPWDSDWDKREKHSRPRQLVIAGALIIAELERHLHAYEGLSRRRRAAVEEQFVKAGILPDPDVEEEITLEKAIETAKAIAETPQLAVAGPLTVSLALRRLILEVTG